MTEEATTTNEQGPMTDKRLTKIEEKLDGIQTTLNKVAVQQEQITSLREDARQLWAKWDDFTKSGGAMDKIVRHQASCPRGQIKFLWWVIVPMGLSILATGIAVIAMAV